MNDDEYFMQRAIQVAELGRETTAPNPWVGCVIVAENSIIAEGFHVRKGGPHAERVALAKVDPIRTNLCMYVTLEPCCHFGATSPCVDAILAFGNIRKVVVAVADPDEKVSGKGIAKLRAAGIEVLLGVCESQARDSLRAYLFQRTHHRPFVVAKLGISLNGVIKTPSRQWITSEASREEGMLIRRQSQAIIVGVNTVIEDNPKLTLRKNGEEILDRLFFRVVIDPHCKVSPSLHFNRDCTKTLIYSLKEFETNQVWPEYIEHVWMNSIDLLLILKNLANRGVLQVLVEGGATTFSKFIEQDLVNELTLFMAPTMMPGLAFFNSLEKVSQWTLRGCHNVPGGDVRMDYSLELQNEIIV